MYYATIQNFSIHYMLSRPHCEKKQFIFLQEWYRLQVWHAQAATIDNVDIVPSQRSLNMVCSDLWQFLNIIYSAPALQTDRTFRVLTCRCYAETATIHKRHACKTCMVLCMQKHAPCMTNAYKTRPFWALLCRNSDQLTNACKIYDPSRFSNAAGLQKQRPFTSFETYINIHAIKKERPVKSIQNTILQGFRTCR